MARLENLEVWKKSVILAKDIHFLCKSNKEMKRDYWLVDQIRRASWSISINIAEWVWRSTKKDTTKFFIIARWSAVEVKWLIYLSKAYKYIDLNICKKYKWQVEEIIKMINGLIKWLHASNTNH